MNTLTKEQFVGTIEILKGMIEAVQASPNGLPSGHLYAHCMAHMSLHQYEALLDIMLELNRLISEVMEADYNGNCISCKQMALMALRAACPAQYAPAYWRE